MPQATDYVIANQAGAAVRSELNSILAAVVSQNSGATEPTETYAYMLWADTTTTRLKIRSAGDSAWIDLGSLGVDQMGMLAGVAPTDSGTADALVVAPTIPWTALDNGRCLLLRKAASASTTASPTLNVSSLGAKKLYDESGNTLLAGALKSGMLILAQYDTALDGGSGGYRCLGVRRGRLVQRVEASYTTATSTAATLAYDDTLPQNTEGLEVLTASITPKDAANRLVVQATAHTSQSSFNVMVVSLFKDSGADALRSSVITSPGANNSSQHKLHYEAAAGGTSASTFKLRGAATSGTLYINSDSTGRKFGGALAWTLTIEEYEA